MTRTTRFQILVGIMAVLIVELSTPTRGQTSEQPDMAAWAAQVEQQAPARPTVTTESTAPRELLVFSLHTGYHHTVIPYVDRVFQILGEKSKAFHVTVSRNIEDLSAENLKRFDVLVLNNTCSVGPRRNLFLDVLEKDQRYTELTEQQRQKRAEELEHGLIEFVNAGKGLVAIHGAPTMLNNSEAFSQMIGGAFDYHPPSQQATVMVTDTEHPLTAAFRGQGPLVYRDEPYCFKGAYDASPFRPLLAFENQQVKDPQGKFDDRARYAAWIKPHGQGRVFFCSPGHYAECYTFPALLQFLLDGIQYAAGDLKCADKSP
jgi:type 1 glutamine amidotransferase